MNMNYNTCEEILPSDQSRIIKQVKFIYSPLDQEFVQKNNWKSRNKTS